MIGMFCEKMQEIELSGQRSREDLCPNREKQTNCHGDSGVGFASVKNVRSKKSCICGVQWMFLCLT